MSEKCFMCNGKGFVWKQMCSNGGIENTCLWCNGTGKIILGEK